MEKKLPLVVMLDFLDEVSIEKSVLDGVANVVPLNLKTEDALPDIVKEADAVLGWHIVTFGKNTLDKLENTKIVVRVGIGIDTVDLEEAGKLGIYVANVPDYGIEEVADSAINHILNLMRCTFYASYQINKGYAIEKARSATRLRGKVLGLVGFGCIGKAVALRAKPFGFHIIYYDPYVADGVTKALGVERVDTLKELIEKSDVLSLHCWLDANNIDIINKESLSWIKPEGCYFINTARGGLVDENALVEALKDGRIKGAALDVTKVEPYVDGPLLDPHLNLIMTPHSAFLSKESFVEMRQKAAMEIKRVLQGEKPRNCVNLKFLHQARK